MMKVGTFTTRLIHLNNCLPYFLPDRVAQMATTLPDDEVNEIHHHVRLDLWRKEENDQARIQLPREVNPRNVRFFFK